MFRFAPDDAMYQPQTVPQSFAVVALREALTAVRLRVSYIGHPAEPRRPDGGPDWSKPLGVMASVLELTAGIPWPIHTVWAPPTVVVDVGAQKGGQG